MNEDDALPAGDAKHTATPEDAAALPAQLGKKLRSLCRIAFASFSRHSRPRRRKLSSSQTRVKDAMLAQLPTLRAFAVSLCGNFDRADDLVQETLLKAWQN